MSRNTIKIIDEATALLWKTDVIDRLRLMEMISDPMEQDLIRMLRPNYKPKAHMLLDLDINHTDAVFLRKGMAKLYIVYADGSYHILHIWIENEIIVLYEMFRKRLKNTKYYIQLIEDAELVSISIDCMEEIYNKYPVAEKLTNHVLIHKDAHRLKQMEILGYKDKSKRPAMFEKMFPEFCFRLTNEDRAAFLGTGESTLFRGKS
ncbi:CRP-like cAMP-binding protein [Pedobacter sp. AK017]|uniref:Crp/Fnr family transcriptional regulator n=1 Tax=Pedobacter sp. AK017 TaxID=2723073 RepID=UPI0016122D05|nr:Crp/Fnr family transcriptional regulator [Pedobacter sp. AK017]MBB5437880.1 CRP-like cAMP-binding protein [Pedobacter sp. AK017]